MAFCRDDPETISYNELSEYVQLWLRGLGYPAVNGFSPREPADRLKVSRRLVTYWLRRSCLRQVDEKIPTDSFRRFCRAHSDQITYIRLDEETQGWLRGLGHSPAAGDAQPSAAAEAGCDDSVDGFHRDHQPEYA